ncbi:MAG: hypothetical protein H7333_12475 [Bdellovibrionales bacterium]|nr:hypothetical protein [Oligoflexia bacterium]
MRKGLPWIVIGVVLLGLAYFLKAAPGITPSTAVSPTPSPLAEVSPSASPVELQLPRSAKKLEAKDQRKLVVLQQILSSHNDNDPRMDTELTNLNVSVKKAMVQYYAEMPAEKRNDRGTIVFLIGRELNSKADLDFMKSVLMEKPCLSLKNCDETAEAANGEDEHLEGINATTANYPQLNAIRACVAQYRDVLGRKPPNQAFADQIISTLREATRSPNPSIANEATNALHYLKQ